MHDIFICYMQNCQAMLKRGVCELAHSFFLSNIIHSYDMSIIQQFLTNQTADDEIIIVMTPYCSTHVAYVRRSGFTKFEAY